MADVSTVFGVIEKNKTEEDYEDLLYLFRQTQKATVFTRNWKSKEKAWSMWTRPREI